MNAILKDEIHTIGAYAAATARTKLHQMLDDACSMRQARYRADMKRVADSYHAPRLAMAMRVMRASHKL